MHHAANLWNRGDDLLSTFWVITTGPSCVMKGRRERRESQSEGGREGGRAGVIKKGGNRVYEIGLKALQGLERERKKKGRDRKIERKGGLIESD